MNAAAADPRTYDYSRPSRSCDMVMKGGITSGVVYPHAVCELAQVYRFRSVGGASAGAIAAAATAAAELGRTSDSGGFAELAALPDWLGTNLFSVFQPQPETRALFAILTTAITKGPRHALRVLGTAVRGFWAPTLLGALPGLLLVVLALALASGWGLALALVAAVLVLLVGSALGLVLGILRTATRALPANYFGLCTGMAEPENAQPQPLTIWLGELLERLAGRQPGGPPLTFGDLWRGDTPDASDSIRLEMMTTNLTNRRPHRLPWNERVFYFRPSELLDLFPAHVVQWMVEHPPPAPKSDADRRESELRTRLLDLAPWPAAKDLPVIVAARMSLSFPLLISAVPLWAVDMGDPANQEAWKQWESWLGANADGWDEIKDDRSRWTATPTQTLAAGRCWFSDGGISSNFPVHFFDSPVPTRPTFAIDLAGFRSGETPSPDQSGNVWLPDSNQGGLLENWYGFDTGSGPSRLVGFVSAMVRTMQNRVDSAQMRVPGYRDRIVHVKFTKEEGGMNLTMPPEVIGALTERGRWSGAKLIERFHLPPKPGELSWDNHRWVRFRSSLAAVGQLVQRFAGGYSEPPETPGERTYAQLAARTDAEPPTSYRWKPHAQRLLADDAAAHVVALAAVLDASAESLSDGGPRPEPEARIVPRV